MNPVDERVPLPAAPGAVGSIPGWASTLVQQASAVFQRIGFRLNRVLPKDGSEAMTGGLTLATYTVASRPTVPAGTVVFVSDGGAGAEAQLWNGAAWVNLG